MGAAQQALSGYGVAALTYATWNPADMVSTMVLSNGNLTGTGGTTSGTVRSTIGKSAGKWYWEIKVNNNPNGNIVFGIENATASLSGWPGSDNNGQGFGSASGNSFYGNTTGSAFATAPLNNDVIGVALDASNGTVKFYQNNSLLGTLINAVSGPIFAGVYLTKGFGVSDVITANFGATALTYTPPTGFNAGLYN